METNFQLFGIAHLAILCAIVLLAALLWAVQRRLAPGSKGLRLGLAWVILLETICWDGYLALHGQLAFPGKLPVEFCDVTLYLTVIALFTLNTAVFDLAYYGALSGTAMALLTPNLLQPFPSLWAVQYFVGHGFPVIAVLYMVWSAQARPCAGSVMRAMLGANVWAALDGALDWIWKSNYMYLRTKPMNVSLLDVMGPWPWYILAGEGVGLGMFLLLYLPFRQSPQLEPLEESVSGD